MTTLSRIRCFLALTAGIVFSGAAHGQVDLTGDGQNEAVFGEFQTNEVIVYSGATGAELWRRAGSNGFGWAASAHPDINGDGRADVVVSAPGSGVGQAGFVQALRGTDGQILWTRQYGSAAARFGLGLGVVPDQNGDGATDIVVAMLSGDPSGETAVLLSGTTGTMLAAVPGPVARVLDSTRRGNFKFKTKDLDGSGEVDLLDLDLAVAAAGANDAVADFDFDGSVDAVDLAKVIDEILVPAAVPATPWSFILLSLVDPLLYNDGFMYMTLLAQINGAAPPPERAGHPCAALAELARLAALEYALHLANAPFMDPWAYPGWNETLKVLRKRSADATAAVNRCLAGLGLPPTWKPGDRLPDPPAPPTPPTPAPPPTPVPPSRCPLDVGPPPVPGPGAGEPPCANQRTTNMLVCMTCLSQGVSSEPYGDCLERAREIYRKCMGQVVQH